MTNKYQLKEFIEWISSNRLELKTKGFIVDTLDYICKTDNFSFPDRFELYSIYFESVFKHILENEKELMIWVNIDLNPEFQNQDPPQKPSLEFQSNYASLDNAIQDHSLTPPKIFISKKELCTKSPIFLYLNYFLEKLKSEKSFHVYYESYITSEHPGELNKNILIIDPNKNIYNP